jgi:hypothetical protein
LWCASCCCSAACCSAASSHTPGEVYI